VGHILDYSCFVRIMPLVAKNDSPAIYEFSVAFVKSIHQNKDKLLDRSSSLDDTSQDNTFKQLVEQFLLIVVMRWETGTKPSRRLRHADVKIPRVLQLVQLCLMTGQMEPCRKLFVLLIKVPGNVPEKFETLYSPLIPGLQELSRKEGINICSPPFSDLLQFLVGSYLCDILGPKPREVVVRNIGCGCDDCRLVDKFLTSRATEETFRFVKAR
jgi:hypothetical protein